MSETEIIQRIDNKTDDFINNLKLKERMDAIKKDTLDDLVLLCVKLEYIYNAIRGVGMQSPEAWKSAKTIIENNVNKLHQTQLNNQQLTDALNAEINKLDNYIDKAKIQSITQDYEFNGQTKKSIFDGKYNEFMKVIVPSVVGYNNQENQTDFTWFNNQIKMIDTIQEYYYYNIANFNTNLLPEYLQRLKAMVESNSIYSLTSRIKSGSDKYFPVDIRDPIIPVIYAVFPHPFEKSNLAIDCIIEYLNIYIKMIEQLLDGHALISIDWKGGSSKKSRKYRKNNNKTRHNRYKINKYRK